MSTSGSHNTHARLSPSKAKQWVECTASVAFCEANADRIPPRESKWADEGTEAHDWAAKLLLGEITVDDIPEAFRLHVAAYARHCQAEVPEGAAPLVETQVPLFYQPDQTGTVDFAVVTPAKVVIRDLKYGAGVLVPAEENLQLAIYALSLIRWLGDDLGFGPATVVDIGIFQPRHHQADSHRPWVISLRDLELFCERVTEAVDDIRSGDTNFNPSEDACRWCVAKDLCGMREGWALAGRRDLLLGMPDLTKKEAKLPADERVEIRAGSLDDATLVRLFAARKRITAFLDDVAEALEARALAGNPAPGTKLVTGREGNRAWANEDAADTFLKGQGLKQDDRYNYKLKSPTQIEDILSDKLAASKRTATRFAELITRSPGKPTLVAEDDRRSPVEAPVDTMPNLAAGDMEI